MQRNTPPILKEPAQPSQEQVLELLGEDADVSVRSVDRGGVRVAVRTQTRSENIDIELTERQVDVERVAINREVEAVPPVREEGDVTIISVVEEVVETHIRLILKEEIHLRRVSRIIPHHQSVTLREQHVDIDRFAARNPG